MSWPEFIPGEKLPYSDLNKMRNIGAAPFTAGEALQVRKAVYHDDTGDTFTADADTYLERIRVAGITEEAATIGQRKVVRYLGIVDGFDFGAATAAIGETNSASYTASSADNCHNMYSGQASWYQLFQLGLTHGNITAITLFLTKVGSGSDVTVDVYEIDDTGAPTGSALGTKSLTAASITSGAVNKFTFASAITNLEPGKTYLIKALGTSGDVSNSTILNGNNTVGITALTHRGRLSSSGGYSNQQTCYFIVHTTLTRSWRSGEPVYLSSATPGSLAIETTTAPAANAAEIVGRIIDRYRVMMGYPPSPHRLLVKYGFKWLSQSQNGTYGFSLGVPRGTNRIIVTYVGAYNRRGTVTLERNGPNVAGIDFNNSSNAGFGALFTWDPVTAKTITGDFTHASAATAEFAFNVHCYA